MFSFPSLHIGTICSGGNNEAIKKSMLKNNKMSNYSSEISAS